MFGFEWVTRIPKKSKNNKNKRNKITKIPYLKGLNING